MAATPDVRFVLNEGARLAWMTDGDGPPLMIVPPLFGNIEIFWEHEYGRRVNELLGRHFRTVGMDKLGMGLSDRYHGGQTLDQQVSDVLAVMDAAGVERASLVGLSGGAHAAAALAARHPERVDKLVLGNGAPGATISARLGPDPELQEFFGRVFATWGEDGRVMLERFAPSLLDDEAFVRWTARYQRLSCTGADVAKALVDSLAVDVYDELPSISAPTLVANGTADLVVNPASGEMLAERIPGAERLLQHGGDHFLWFQSNWVEMMQPVIEFLLGAPMKVRTERRFAAVVFTDIVGSTRRSAAAGDRAWSETLDVHDRAAWRLADATNGTIVKSTGDGLLARFESPAEAIEFCCRLRSEVAAVGLPIRAGVHVGEIEIRQNQDIAGLAVNLAARVEQAAADGSVFVSSTVRDMMLGGATDFVDRGEHELKGIDGRWRLYEVDATATEPQRLEPT